MKEIIIEVPDRFGKTLKPEKVNCEIKGELIRCKDCIWYDQRDGICEHHAVINNPSPDWFCADVERAAKRE